MQLVGASWRRFRSADGFVSALILAVGLLIVVLPVLIVAFAALQRLLGENGSLATFFVKRMSLGRPSAAILAEALTPTADTATAGALLGAVTFLFGGGSTISVVMVAYDRAISGHHPDAPRASIWRGLAWFVFAGGFVLVAFLPASTTVRFQPPPPLAALSAFGQATVFYFVTALWLPRRRPRWSAALAGAVFAGGCTALVVVSARLTFAPLLGALHFAFGAFGVALMLGVLFYVFALVTMAAPCMTAAWMERRGHEPILRRRDRRPGQVPQRRAEHWVRFSPGVVQAAFKWAAGSGFPRMSRTLGWKVYQRYRDVDGGNLAAALALTAFMVLLPASVTLVALLAPLRRAQTSFSGVLTNLLFLRGDDTAAAMLNKTVAPGQHSANWWGLALLTIVPFLPLLMVVAQRAFNRPWAPEQEDVYNARKGTVWVLVSGVLLVVTLLPLVSGRGGLFKIVPLSLRVFLFMFFTSWLLTLRGPRMRARLGAVAIGTVLFLGVSMATGYALGTWLTWYENLLGPIGTPILIITWASALAVTVVLVPAIGAVLAERRASRVAEASAPS
ncbi:MAG: hypothetical protein U0U69_07400 [Acidimicrobiia bacterium]